MKTTTPTTKSRRAIGVSRLAIGVAGVASGLALLLTPLGASGQVNADVPAPAASVITVTQTPSGILGECVKDDAALGTLQVYPYSTMDFFQLTVIATAPLCNPIQAKAAVYAMPAEGQWPQTFVETKAVTIQEAGTTVITFAKGCDRVQYDLVTGATPQQINTGFDHTLLFPGNLGTAFQHVGNGPNCVLGSTTIAPTTTAAVTTTTGNVSKVLTETTLAPTTTIPSAVLAATTVPNSGTANTALAVTGTTTSGPVALIGGGLVFIGLAFMMASRRRTA